MPDEGVYNGTVEAVETYIEKTKDVIDQVLIYWAEEQCLHWERKWDLFTANFCPPLPKVTWFCPVIQRIFLVLQDEMIEVIINIDYSLQSRTILICHFLALYCGKLSRLTTSKLGHVTAPLSLCFWRYSKGGISSPRRILVAALSLWELLERTGHFLPNQTV